MTSQEPLSEPLYLDASALVKLVVSEPESDALNTALRECEDVIVSDLAISETASAIGRRSREGGLTRSQSRRLYREVQKVAAYATRAELTPPVHRRAERLLLTAAGPLRTLDALHIALAVEAGAATVLTYDPRLREAAASRGLFVALPGRA